MFNKALVLSTALAACIVLLAHAFDAEAARFGGGRSFGGSRSYSKSYSMPKSSVQSPTTATTQQPSALASPAMRPGFGGMFGGLLAGSLIGALFFGGGFHGIGMLDILLVGLGLYLFFKILGRMRSASMRAAGTASGSSGAPLESAPTLYDTAFKQNSTSPSGAASTGATSGRVGGFDWDTLSGKGSQPETSNGTPASTPPPGFDREDFLRGAKAAYKRLNSSWDKRDLADIAHFSTRPFMEYIEEQAEEDPQPSTTDILLVEAELLEFVTESGRETATVFFSVLLRENPQESTPKEVKEVWHFVRAANSDETWKLDGIQQVTRISE